MTIVRRVSIGLWSPPQRPRTAATLLTGCLAACLVACGGGIDGTGATPPPGGATITSSGVMTVGSVVLNARRFDAAGASVADDRGRGPGDLADGMVIRLRGAVEGTAASAERIAVHNELRARISQVDAGANPPRFVAGGVTVLLDTQTVFAGGSAAALAEGTRVEVHGLRDAQRRLRATRVELLGAQQGADELRARVDTVTAAAGRFTLEDGITVAFAGATFRPAGAGAADLAPGRQVEVRGALAGGTFTATEVVIESLEDAAYAGASGEAQDVEGYVSGFGGHPGTFEVDGRRVATTASTRFESGSAADLGNDVRIEAHGTVDAQGVLVLANVEFKSVRIALDGLATQVGLLPPALTVLAQAIRPDDLTRIEALDAGGQPSTRLADIAAGTECVSVRARPAGILLIAESIRETACGAVALQAPISAKDDAAFTLRFFDSFAAEVGGAGVVFRDAAGVVITRAEFFAALSPPRPGVAGTLVGVRGALAGGVLLAQEASLLGLP